MTSAPFPGFGTLVVRPCVQGGLWGRFAGDRYFGLGRAHREIVASERLLRLGIPTPRIEAALFYPKGPWMRMEIATSLVPQGADLNHLLSARPASKERSRMFFAVRRLFSQLHRHGIRHPDLNARNILLAPSRSGWTGYLLDVDTVLFETPSAPAVDRANRNRLLRSLLKRARLGDLGWSEAEVPQLWRELFPRR